MAESLPEGVDEIAPDVYDVTCREGNDRRYRAFVFDGDPPTLVDTTHADYAETLLERIEALGVTPERLLLTHGDADHFAGFDAVVDRLAPETWVPEELTAESEHVPDHRFADGDRIGPFRAVHVPGHTPDNYVLIEEDRGVAVLGDALVGSDVRGLPPGYLIMPPEIWSDDLHAAERNLERLLEHEFDVGLVFHGSSVTADAWEKLEAYVNFPSTRPD